MARVDGNKDDEKNDTMVRDFEGIDGGGQKQIRRPQTKNGGFDGNRGGDVQPNNIGKGLTTAKQGIRRSLFFFNYTKYINCNESMVF